MNHRINTRVAAMAAGMALVLLTPGAAAEESMSWKTVPGTYARFETSEGLIVCRLFDQKSPITVKNFVELAEGKKEFTDPTIRAKAKRPYFDGTKFHRIIPNFMIQGGDPTATGSGGPGFTIPDEFDPSLDFSKPGRLAMANSGPNTGGSQFFITQVPTTWLNGKHTIFGEVVEGQANVDKIAGLGAPGSGKPKKDVLLNKVVIERIAGSGAQK